MENINNGDVYDIGQTVNGVSRFVYVGGKWYYFERRVFYEYEYDNLELFDLVRDIHGDGDVKFLGNIFDEFDFR